MNKNKTSKLLLIVAAWILFSTATEARKPDVLFIAIDDMNDWTTLFDQNNPIQTPNLERLAARGTFLTGLTVPPPGVTRREPRL